MIVAMCDNLNKNNVVEIEGKFKNILNEFGNLNANVIIQLMDGMNDEEERKAFKTMIRGFINYVLDDVLENGRNSNHIEKGETDGGGKTIREQN
jgi:hypothetical protein